MHGITRSLRAPGEYPPMAAISQTWHAHTTRRGGSEGSTGITRSTFLHHLALRFCLVESSGWSKPGLGCCGGVGTKKVLLLSLSRRRFLADVMSRKRCLASSSLFPLLCRCLSGWHSRAMRRYARRTAAALYASASARPSTSRAPDSSISQRPLRSKGFPFSESA